MRHLIQLDEPQLRFGHRQALAHPKDGLTLFGPHTRTAGSVRYGVIGTQAGLDFFDRWIANINRHLPAYEGSRFRRKKNAEYGKLAHQFFPGFETTFGITWNQRPECRCVLPDDLLADALKVHERHTRIARVVKLYSKRLIKTNYQDASLPWIVLRRFLQDHFRN